MSLARTPALDPAAPLAGATALRPAKPRLGDGRLASWLIDLYFFYALLIATNAIFPLLMMGDTMTKSVAEDATLRLLLLPVLAGAPVVIGLQYRAMLALLARNPVLLLLLVWIWCSALWSVAPGISFRRAVALTTFTLVGAAMVLRYDLDRLLNRMAWLFFALLLLSVVFVVAFPGMGVMPDGRGLRGIYTHKNGMGGLLLLTLVVFVPVVWSRLVNPVVGWGGLLLTLGLLVPTGSATAIVVALLIMAIQAVILLRQHSGMLAAAGVAFGAALVAGATLLLLGLGAGAFELLGRDGSLTGRTDIWHYALRMIAQRWLLGYGYEALWMVPSYALYAVQVLAWEAPNSHNGYLETMLGLGIVGLGLAVALLVVNLVRLARLAGRLEPVAMLVALPFMVGFVVRNFMESGFINQTSLDWVVLAMVSWLTTSGLAELRRR